MKIATLIGRNDQLRAVPWWLGLLLVAALAAWSHPAAARTPGPAAQASVVADSGFRPIRDGYAFANYVNQAGRPNLGSGEMRRLFGDAVCAGFNGGACVLSPPALAWMQQQNAAMAGGHCFGFSVSALLFWSSLSSPSPVRCRPGAGAEDRRQPAAGARDRLWARVPAARIGRRRAGVELAARGDGNVDLGAGTRAARCTRSASSMPMARADTRSRPTPSNVSPRDRYAILVYDNNFPGRTRKVLVNTKTDTWSYNAAREPARAGEPLHRQRHHRFAAAAAGSSRAGRAAVSLLRAADRPATAAPMRAPSSRRPRRRRARAGVVFLFRRSGCRRRARSAPICGSPTRGAADRLCARAAGQRDPRRANRARVRRRTANVA